jgi:hypothetical protein
VPDEELPETEDFARRRQQMIDPFSLSDRFLLVCLIDDQIAATRYFRERLECLQIECPQGLTLAAAPTVWLGATVTHA